AKDTIARHISTQIGMRSDVPWLRAAWFGHVEERARLRIALAEEKKIKRQLTRHDDEVGLNVSQRHPRRRRRQLTRAGRSPPLGSCCVSEIGHRHASLQGSRHAPRAVAQSGRHTERACYSTN